MIGKIVTLGELDENQRALLFLARDSMDLSNAFLVDPNDGLLTEVGTAVEAFDGRPFPGGNDETRAYASSMCGDRDALYNAKAAGYRKQLFRMAIVARRRDPFTREIINVEEPYPPCGACLQVIDEFAEDSGAGRDFEVITANTDLSVIVMTTIGELLPWSFVRQRKS